MEKLQDRMKVLQYQRWRLKQQMLTLDPGVQKKMGSCYFELDRNLDLEWIERHQLLLLDEKRRRIMTKFETDKDRLEKELELIEEMEQSFQTENNTGKVKCHGKGVSMEKLKKDIANIEKRLEATMLQAEDKENNKEIALGTSKLNYIDPRLTVVFSKRFNVPISKMFSKSLQEKFDWAIRSVDEDWEF